MTIYPKIKKSRGFTLTIDKYTPDLLPQIEEELFRQLFKKDATTQKDMAVILGMCERTFRKRLKELRRKYEVAKENMEEDSKLLELPVRQRTVQDPEVRQVPV